MLGQTGSAGDVALAPFYRTQRRNYSVYFDVLTPAEFDSRGAAMAAERERSAELEAATVSFVQPGETQPERDYNYQSDPADRRRRANQRARKPRRAGLVLVRSAGGRERRRWR